jgi:cytochrome c-type biogenesis protein CcmF
LETSLTPLIGRILILTSLLVATAGAMTAFAAGATRSLPLERWSKILAHSFFATMAGANLLMVWALVTHDFSVSYVAQVGSRDLPTWVSIVSLWSSLEGSILFWGFVLGLYISAALWLIRDRESHYIPYATGVWLACAAFFSFLLSGPAQPFLSMSPVPLDGPGPNPLLQNHILMIVHPPMLYLGYVGMTIPFGLASAALIRGRLGDSIFPAIRNSLLLAWTFLTVAIVLGGWWAYEVLGWGGYWAWDPVENASLLPWLTGTAALHSAIVMERRRILKGWTLTLICASFLLVILGTFMTRSGVFNSVHSFTQSDIGPTLLMFLAVALIWSIVLLAVRVDKLTAEGTIEDVKSRESIFLVNNLLFVLMTLTVLIGTVFPLVVEALKGVQMSVGRPYFDKMTVPIGVALLFLIGVGPALPWGRASKEQMMRGLLPPLIGGGIVAIAGLLLGVRSGWTVATLFFGGYAAQVTLREMWRPVVQRMRLSGENVFRAFWSSQMERGRRRFGAYVAHAGAVLIFISIAVSSTMGSETEVQLARGETATLGRYSLTLVGVEQLREPHREAHIARVAISDNGRSAGTMAPRMNFYSRSRDPMGTPDVRTRFTHDLYLSVTNIDPVSQRAGLQILINPMVGWIWIATAIIGIGGLMALARGRRAAVAAVNELSGVDAPLSPAVIAPPAGEPG